MLKYKITGARGVLHRQRGQLGRRAEHDQRGQLGRRAERDHRGQLGRRADRDQQAGASTASRRELGVDQAELGLVPDHSQWLGPKTAASEGLSREAQQAQHGHPLQVLRLPQHGSE